MNIQIKVLTRAILAGILCVGGSVNGQVTVSDNFTGATNTMSWTTVGSACLTAGTTASSGSGQIGKCSPNNNVGNSGNTAGEGGYGGVCADGTTQPNGCYAASKMDPIGNGALRLTTAESNKASAIIWNSYFANNAGISITFNAVSYNGDKQSGDGADILGFFLLDYADVSAAQTAGYSNVIGSFGGSGGYTCSNGNSPYNGALSGYIGLAIDEYGNFLNAGDNTATGVPAPPSGSNVGPVVYGSANNGYTNPPNISGTSIRNPQRIGIRGTGKINPYQLSTIFPTFYPATASVTTSMVQKACGSGTIWNYSGSTINNVSTGNISSRSFTGAISSSTTLTVSKGSIPPGTLIVGTPIKGSNVASGQSICGITTDVSSTTNGTFTLCTGQSSVSSETMQVPACITGASACGSTVGSVSSGSNMNCAVMVNNAPVTYSALNTQFPSYYPSSLNAAQQSAAVISTCETATLWNYSTPTAPTNLWIAVSDHLSAGGAATFGYLPNSKVLYDYIPLANANLMFPETIANETAGARGNATMRTYNLKITSSGLLSLSYADDDPITGAPGAAMPVLTNSPIFANNGPLPANFTFGFASSTGGSNNIHEITCFQASPADTSDSSAGVNVVQTGQVKTGTQIYLAYYHSSSWWGQLTSQNLVWNSSTNTVTVQSNANWDSSCVLTGDTPPASTNSPISASTLPGTICQATYVSGVNPANTDVAMIPIPYSTGGRQIFTYNGGGVPLEWTNLSGAQRSALTGTDSTTVGQQRLSYLRGDRSNEVTVNATTGAVTGLFRPRVGVLGDIVDSSPTWVGAPLHRYPSGAGVAATSWVDTLNPTVAFPENVNTYGNFQTNNVARLNMVFAGANDGMMHGFEAGAFDSTGAFVSTHNDGKEVLAYMPAAVLNNIHNSTTASLDYSSPNFAHSYYVDATPDVDDLYFGGAWHTWLVSGLAGGGNALFALDITTPATTAPTPSNPAFPESTAANLVVGEWNSSTAGLGNDLGQTYGTPSIKRLHSGNWAIIFGNGYNSPNGVGGIFVGLVDPTSGAVTFEFLSTGVGSAGSPNGIFNVFLADLDGDEIVDFVYAGDLQGNVWRWDLTQTYATVPDPSTWAGAVPAPIKLFQTASGQPITTQVQVASVPSNTSRERLMVEFGTGEQITGATSTTYAIGQQAMYGIWDGNMSSWNSMSTIDNQYVPFPSAYAQPYTVQASTLQTQSDTSASGSNYRILTANSVCWANQTACVTKQFGWMYNFPLPSGMSSTTAAASVLEQLIYNPVVQNGALVFNTYIAASNQACVTSNPSGWTMALNPATGGSFSSSFFGSSSGYGSSAGNSTNSVVSGLHLGASGSPSFVEANSVSYLLTQTLGAPAPGSAGSAAAQAAIVSAQTALAAAQLALTNAQTTLANDIAAGASASTIAADQAAVTADQAAVVADQAAVAQAQANAGAFVTQVNVAPGPGYRLNWTEIR